MIRRAFLKGLLAAGATPVTIKLANGQGAATPASWGKLNWSDEKWRQALPKDRYEVLRHEATEPPHSSPFNEEHRKGTFVCAGCGLGLFTSDMKFDCGTGWPSFFTHIPGVFETKRDFKLLFPRTEYHCSRCGGHHGHVINDGPRPTGLRYCNNGLALRFVPA